METTPAAKYFFRESLSALVVGALLFGSAGRVDWWPAWVELVVVMAVSVAIGLIGIRTRPNLLSERAGARRGDEKWDVAIYSGIRLGSLACFVVGGLDQRCGWTGVFPVTNQIAGLVIHLLGLGLFVWAVASNRFFSDMVRIRTNDGHVVATGGPYRCVRHPGYAGSIAYYLALPMLLASWWAFIPAALCAVAFVVRTVLEDRTLSPTHDRGFVLLGHNPRRRCHHSSSGPGQGAAGGGGAEAHSE
jgi:protein-S-isoprenylcysteine O-methyltransferase Ste14